MAQRVPLSEMAKCLSGVLGWINPPLQQHQLRVAYMAGQMANLLQVPLDQRNRLLLSALFHDLGAFSAREAGAAPDKRKQEFVRAHCELGYLLLKEVDPFAEIARIVRHHHQPWGGADANSTAEPGLGNLLFLADFIDSHLHRDREVLGQAKEIVALVRQGEGRLFSADAVEAFTDLAQRDSFWFSLEGETVRQITSDGLDDISRSLPVEEVLQVSRMFSHIIDFRCRFTATHSTGVAATAETLARLCSVEDARCRKIRVAGHLHDLGKLTIPSEILSKPGALTEEEFNLVKSHPFRTYQALKGLNGLEDVTAWAALHHERIDSRGYPFRHRGESLPLEARILAVADVFTALTEDRPYRSGLDRPAVLGILEKMVTDGAVDGSVVEVLFSNYEEIDGLRQAEQQVTAHLYSACRGAAWNSACVQAA